MPRLILIEVPEKRPKKQKASQSPPAPALVNDIRTWFKDNMEEPFVVEETDEAIAALDQFEDHCHSICDESNAVVEPFFTRAAENAGRLALIHACSRKYLPDHITIDDMKWGIALARYSAELQAFHVSNNISENNTEEMHNKVWKIVDDTGKRGLSQTELSSRCTWMRATERKEIQRTLLEIGRIVKVTCKTTGGRAKLTFFSRRNSPGAK